MKRLSTVLVVLSVIALLGLESCSGAETDADCDGESCGTARLVSGAEPEVLVPTHSFFDSQVAMTDLLFWKLAELEPNASTISEAGYAPRLAEAWQREDSVTIRFRMHLDARWHDGAPVTAHDVVFTFEVYTDPDVGASGASRLVRIQEVTARDSATAVFRFTERYPEQLFDAVYHMRILPKHLLDSIPFADIVTHAFGRTPVGNGPFRFVRWQRGEFIELAANADFFAGRPGASGIIWRYADDLNAQISMLIAGEADFMLFVPPPFMDRVNANADLRVQPVPIAGYNYIAFNLRDPDDLDRPHPLFDNRALRRALAMAVDKQTVIEAAVGDAGSLIVSPLATEHWVWSDQVARIPYDPDEARANLATLGWSDSNGDAYLDNDGTKLEFELIVPATSAGRRQAAIFLQEQLKQIGVDMVVTTLEANTWHNRTQNGQFDATFYGTLHDPSPASLEEEWSTGGERNYGAYSNARVDALIDQSLTLFDPDEARAKWQEIVSLINEDAPAIWVYAPKMLPGINDRLENITFDPFQWWRHIWTWRVTSSNAAGRDLASSN